MKADEVVDADGVDGTIDAGAMGAALKNGAFFPAM
jgi:hypothetical protein